MFTNRERRGGNKETGQWMKGGDEGVCESGCG